MSRPHHAPRLVTPRVLVFGLLSGVVLLVSSLASGAPVLPLVTGSPPEIDGGFPDAGVRPDGGPDPIMAKPEPRPRKELPKVRVFTQEFLIPEPDSVQSEVSFSFFARVDRVLTGAELRIVLQPTFRRFFTGIERLEVLVNGEIVTSTNAATSLTGFLWDDLIEHREARTIAIPPQLMTDRNLLTLRFRLVDNMTCPEVEEGVWRIIKSIQLITEGAPLPLPNNLALLPLPFIDRDFDKESTVPVVLGPNPGEDHIQLAGVVASWFGTTVAQTLDFPVSIGDLPDSSAVVLIDNVDDATALGLPPPDGPMIRMLDHPSFPGTNLKLFLIAGTTPEELRIAVYSVAAQVAPLAGDVMHFQAMPSIAPSRPYDAPRWLPVQRDVPFAQYPLTPYSGSSTLIHKGARDGTIAFRFRLAPDVWTWPTEFVDLDLGWTVELSPGTPMPRLDLDFNGVYIDTLPDLDWPRDGVGRQTIRLRAEQLRGFNEFQLHVHYRRMGDECENDPLNESKVSIALDSALHIDRYGHYANQPDVSMFVHDGYPFTRVADLGETAVIFGPKPHASEIATFLSIVANFGSVTGRVGSRVTVLTAEHFFQQPRLQREKDLLIIGVWDSNPLLQRWAEHMPLVLGPSGGRVQMPVMANPFRRVWNLIKSYFDMERARDVLFRQRKLAAVEGFISPAYDGREAIVVTATSPALMPALSSLTGVLDTRFRSGDLLLSAGTQRWMFHIGPVHGRGTLGWWTAIRRFFALDWVLLFPGMVIGSIFIATQLRAGMGRRIRRRLMIDGSADTKKDAKK